MAETVRTSANREYEVLAGPFTGNNGSFHVLRDMQDQEVVLMHSNQVETLRKNS